MPTCGAGWLGRGKPISFLREIPEKCVRTGQEPRNPSWQGQPDASEKACRPHFSMPPATALASVSLCLQGSVFLALGEAADAPPDTVVTEPRACCAVT